MAKAKRKPKLTPKAAPTAESFTELVAGLRAAVEAARTWDEFEEARAQIRRALTYPTIVGSTDLWSVCERKRLTFAGQAP